MIDNQKQTAEDVLADLREGGWSVAAHNDYRAGGEHNTFWLLIHPNGRWVKGEAHTDLDALLECRRYVERNSAGGRMPQPYASRIKDMGVTAWVEFGFSKYGQAEKFWRWAEKELSNATR